VQVLLFERCGLTDKACRHVSAIIKVTPI